MKFKKYKITCWTTALIPADENEWFITDAIDSIIMNAKPEDWIYEDCEVVDEIEKGSHCQQER